MMKIGWKQIKSDVEGQSLSTVSETDDKTSILQDNLLFCREVSSFPML